jgi:prepilin-type N-terminal cleavage/methylation domain-containing protein
MMNYSSLMFIHKCDRKCHSRESGNPGKHWIPGQARNDKRAARRGWLKGFQGGFTFIEIIVVIVILAIVSAISIKFLSDSVRIYTMTVNQKTLFDEAKLALERMCRDIRDANGITTPLPGASGIAITFTRTNGTTQDGASENITFRLTGNSLEKVKPAATATLASYVSTFTVTRGAAGNDEITLLLDLQRTSGEHITLQTKVYPKNLPKDLTSTYKNFRIQDALGNYSSWQEARSL